MTKLLIKITKEILDRSSHCGYNEESGLIGHNCAVACAVRDIFPKAYVTGESIFPYGVKGSIALIGDILLPLEAQLFIGDFDKATAAERVCMNEFQFEVYLPDSVIEQINISEITQLLQDHPTLKLTEV